MNIIDIKIILKMVQNAEWDKNSEGYNNDESMLDLRMFWEWFRYIRNECIEIEIRIMDCNKRRVQWYYK